ncbi:hypothetical protein [Ralstonia sp. GP101]|uniref:hypothetical protein n=1 Tax=Ralstonia sp. GP101 TaxID=3035146 RepID=UPI00389283D2
MRRLMARRHDVLPLGSRRQAAFLDYRDQYLQRFQIETHGRPFPLRVEAFSFGDGSLDYLAFFGLARSVHDAFIERGNVVRCTIWSKEETTWHSQINPCRCKASR